MPTALLRLTLILPLLIPSAAASAPADDLVRTVLLSPNDPPNMITVLDEDGCIVLLNGRGSGHAVVRFGNIDPASVELQGRGRDSHLRVSGAEPVIEVFAANGTSYQAQSLQITASRSGKELAALREIVSRCSGPLTS